MAQLQNMAPLWGGATGSPAQVTAAQQPTPATPAAGGGGGGLWRDPNTGMVYDFTGQPKGGTDAYGQPMAKRGGYERVGSEGAAPTPTSFTPTPATPGAGGGGGGGGGSTNFLAANPMGVAGIDPLQAWAAQNIPGIGNTPEAERIAGSYGLIAPLLAGRMATGQGISTDPGILAASEAFEKLMTPQIENQMGLAGLGKSSSLANALAMGKSSYMLPLITDYLQREQQTLGNQAQMYGSMMPQFAALGGQETARQLQTLNAASTTGAQMRGIAQEPLTSAYQDYLRRQALAEQALFVPFGAMAGPSIGQAGSSTQSQSGSASQGFK